MEPTRLSGLCANCQAGPTCSFLKHAAAPVLQCELFELAAPTTAATPPREDARQRPDVSNPDRPRYPGLCSNCAQRADCTLTKAEAGVWHCEEYR